MLASLQDSSLTRLPDSPPDICHSFQDSSLARLPDTTPDTCASLQYSSIACFRRRDSAGIGDSYLQALGTATPEMAKTKPALDTSTQGKAEKPKRQGKAKAKPKRNPTAWDTPTPEKAEEKPKRQGKAKAKPKRNPPALDTSTPDTATTKKTELQSRVPSVGSANLFHGPKRRDRLA